MSHTEDLHSKSTNHATTTRAFVTSSLHRQDGKLQAALAQQGLRLLGSGGSSPRVLPQHMHSAMKGGMKAAIQK